MMGAMRASPPLRATPLAALVLALGLTATATVTWRLEHVAAQRNEIRFQNAVASVRDRLRGRLDMFEAMLLGAKGLFAGSETVVRDEFSRYVAQLEVERRAPGAQGLGFSLRFAPGERGRIEGEMRAAGFPQFRVWPDGSRPEYHTILYLEPLDRRNRAALGFDMHSEGLRAAAMDRARDTGRPAATGRVTLVQEIDTDKQPGFLIYVPIYQGGETPATVPQRRARLRGFVYSPFRSQDFVQGIFGSEPAPMVSFAVFEAGSSEPVLRSVERGTPVDYRPRLHTTFTVENAGQSWQVALATTPAFDAISSGGRTVLLAGVGTLFSLLLAMMMAAQGAARARAEQSDRTAQAERAHLLRLFM
jgi:CHASE1-domain containing sensor protein